MTPLPRAVCVRGRRTAQTVGGPGSTSAIVRPGRRGHLHRTSQLGAAPRRANRRTAATGALDSLTAGERRVAQLAADGQTNR